MKKSELTQLTQIIEHLVEREVRKKLPSIIAETFQNMMGKSVVTEQRNVAENPHIKKIDESIDDPINLKTSLRELFAGTPVMKEPSEVSQPRAPRHFTKNPILNQILNETTSDLGSRERLVGAAAYQGGYSPSVSMSPMVASEAVEESSFMKNTPSIPISKPKRLVDGEESNHAPMPMLNEGVSALDIVNQVQAPPALKHALTRNYSQMLKLIDKKRGKI